MFTTNFVTLCREGKKTLADLDSFVKDWHESHPRDGEPCLQAALGLTPAEYQKFMLGDVEEVFLPLINYKFKYDWELITPACPEQYDIYRKKDDKEKIAYARFRHETFTVDCPDVMTNTVYNNGGLVDKVPDEWKLEAEEAIDKYYKQEQIKNETIEDIISAFPKLSKDVSRELLSALYDAAFDDGMEKLQQDIFDEYIKKQGCKKCEHYKKSALFDEYGCELEECSFKQKVMKNK